MSSTQPALQWGGRFAAPPDAALLAFGSSLEEDLVLAPFDVRCSLAHVTALESGNVLAPALATVLREALAIVAREIDDGGFAERARAMTAEDVHGAIDDRVRELAPEAGASLHTGRSRNDQVATTLALYVRARARHGAATAERTARLAIARAREALEAGTLLAATTHWQPAQPILLAFWLAAVAESFARAVTRFERVADDACEASPLGSGACSGSTLPLDRAAAARELGFAAPSRNALDAIGTRELALDLVHAVARALGAASRASEELVLWCTPAFGYARLADAASTGSSLMPQKRNPDPFELVRAHASAANGALAAALGTTTGIALSYHRDLQETKAIAIRAIERGLGALDAFASAFAYVAYDAAAMSARAGDGYTVATDIADALIARGIPARSAHGLVGTMVAAAERAGRELVPGDLDELADAAGLVRPLDAPLDARASVEAKRTIGSTNPGAVATALDDLEATLDARATSA
ncbi:MAG: argininosuccinate lyase [Vulcanimicrobiaceae bacterium]